MYSEIRSLLRDCLASRVDAWISEYGFNRGKSSTYYTRMVEESTQEIDVPIELHPKDNPRAVAAVYPWIQINIPEIERALREIMGGDESIIPGFSRATLRQPVEFTSLTRTDGRWFVYQSDSIPPIVESIQKYLETWAIPFLNEYCSAESICLFEERGDRRILRDRAYVLRVCVAMWQCGRTQDALALLENTFGAPGLRRKYQKIFEYMKIGG
jgi:hypothetical protein